MRAVILSIALLAMALGAVGLVSPTILNSFRRRRLATRRGLYVTYLTAVFRVTTGILLILFAPASRMPMALRVLGAVVCAQGLVQGLGGPLSQPNARMRCSTGRRRAQACSASAP